ncbi:hypothetical protein ALC56_08263 [Trachymyrmex septentrionalis]|uniref:Uncharacterized protein n=1 Tax=Trachymyrmex septentrionalis TaxID=34720 RepID=A0A151JVE6_9HYME|nr:hypothetical protein ALC56_08263 [Trachymyrmex septentrionalis]
MRSPQMLITLGTRGEIGGLLIRITSRGFPVSCLRWYKYCDQYELHFILLIKTVIVLQVSFGSLIIIYVDRIEGFNISKSFHLIRLHPINSKNGFKGCSQSY